MRFELSDSGIREAGKQFAALVADEIDARQRTRVVNTKAGRILLTKREAAELLGISEASVDRLRRAGLPCVKLDGRVMFRPESLDDWAREQEGAAAVNGR